MKLNISTTMEHIIDSELDGAVNDLHSSTEELALIETSITPAVSNEDLISIFNNISGVYKSTISKLKNIFNVAKIKYKTEFKLWSKKEHKVITAVEGLSTEDVKTTVVDYPTGMTITYIEATSLVKQFFTNFEDGARLDLALSTIDSVLNSISKESNAHERIVKTATKTIASSSKGMLDTAKKLEAGFKTISTPVAITASFDKLFKTIDELKQVRTVLEEIDGHVGNINKIEDTVTKIEHSLNLCINYISDRTSASVREGYVPSKEFLVDFSNFIKVLDNIFIAYGDVTLRTLAIQHNLTFVYSKLYTKCK